MKQTILGVSTVIAGALLLASCATTEVTALWRDPGYQKQPKKTLVQAVLKDPANRRLVEEEFTREFRSRGIEAVPAYTVFPGEELPSKGALEEQLRLGGFDTLLLLRLAGERTEARVVPGTPAYPAMAPLYGGWPEYYDSGYSTVYSPGYTVEETYAVAETSLYDVATGKLIWTATSETLLSQADQKLIKSYVKVMMDSLTKNKLVP